MSKKVFLMICVVALSFAWNAAAMRGKATIQGKGDAFAKNNGDGTISYGCDNKTQSDCSVTIEF